MTEPGSNRWRLLLKDTKEDNKDIHEATASQAKEISVDAAAVYSESDGIFKIKEEQKQHSSVEKMFLFYSCPVLARF